MGLLKLPFSILPKLLFSILKKEYSLLLPTIPITLIFVFSCAKKAPEKEILTEERKEKILKEKMEFIKKAEKLKFEEAKANIVPDPYIMFGLALNKENAGDLEEASKFYSYAIELKPNMTDAWVNLSEVKWKTGQKEERIKILEEALKIIPDDSKIWGALAIAYSDIGENKKAEEVLKKAISSIGMKKDVAQSLGYVFLRSKRYSLAIFVFSELLSKYPDDPNIYFIMGDIYMQTKNCLKAKDYFERGLRIKQDKIILNKLGLCYFELGAIDDAKEVFEKALAIDKDFWPAYMNLGIIFKRKSDFENSEKMYLKAFELKKDEPSIIYNLANLYETYASYTRTTPQKALENIEKAKQYLTMYVQYVDNEQDRQNIQKRIEKLGKSETDIKRQLEREMKKLEKQQKK